MGDRLGIPRALSILIFCKEMDHPFVLGKISQKIFDGSNYLPSKMIDIIFVKLLASSIESGACVAGGVALVKKRPLPRDFVKRGRK